MKRINVKMRNIFFPVMADVIAIRRNMVNKETYPLTVPEAGDVTADGKVNMADAIAIRRYMVNKDLYPFK